MRAGKSFLLVFSLLFFGSLSFFLLLCYNFYHGFLDNFLDTLYTNKVTDKIRG